MVLRVLIALLELIRALID
ncbi:hypothetical protein [Salmonella enterica]